MSAFRKRTFAAAVAMCRKQTWLLNLIAQRHIEARKGKVVVERRRQFVGRPEPRLRPEI